MIYHDSIDKMMTTDGRCSSLIYILQCSTSSRHPVSKNNGKLWEEIVLEREVSNYYYLWSVSAVVVSFLTHLRSCLHRCRYSRETEPCDWIVNDYSIFQQLFSPQILNHVASPPGGEIFIRHLNALPGYQQYMSPLDGEANEKDWRQRESHEFPSSDTCRVLHIGCGNSQLGEYMLQSGFTDIVNVDYSEVVIKMSECHCCDTFLE